MAKIEAQRLPRRFLLNRTDDPTGVSGTGIIAYGTLFPNGRTVLTWNGAIPAVTIYNSPTEIVHIHGHDGATTLVWIDPPTRLPRKKNEEDEEGRWP